MFSSPLIGACCNDHTHKSNFCHQSQLDSKFHFHHPRLTSPHTVALEFVFGSGEMTFGTTFSQIFLIPNSSCKIKRSLPVTACVQ